MRKNIRNTLSAGILLICAFSMSACGAKVADEEQIRQELESNTDFQFLKENEQIDMVVIDKRQTDKKQKTDTVWCTVTTSDTEVSCEKDVVLFYGLYDKAGWVLDDMEVESGKQWDVVPLKGIGQGDVLDSLYGHTVIVDNEEWNITKENVVKAEVDSQQTDLDRQEDKVTVSMILDEEVERAEGKIEILYLFDQEWKFDTILSNKEFQASMKEEHALNVTESDLILAMQGAEAVFGEGANRQTISVKAEEISDFMTEEPQVYSKGCHQIFQCGFQLKKGSAEIHVDAAVHYTYQKENGWTAAVNEISARVTSAEISGDWSGTYTDAPWSGRAELHISEMQEDGSVTATYKFIPEQINKYSCVGSYELSGRWDAETLTIYLEAGDWIEQPAWESLSNEKQNITAVLEAETGQLTGRAQGGKYFTVQQ